jgi:hypothetical protein
MIFWNETIFIIYFNLYSVCISIITIKMKFFFCWLLTIAIKVFSVDIVPSLISLAIIPSWQSSIIRKIDSNSNLLIALTNDAKVYNWNRTDYSRSKDVVEPLNAHYGASYISYNDLSFDNADSISLSAYCRAGIINITSSAI